MMIPRIQNAKATPENEAKFAGKGMTPLAVENNPAVITRGENHCEASVSWKSVPYYSEGSRTIMITAIPLLS
jgi:hypothetical protein